MKKLIVRIVREEEGATALEYALMAVLIALAMGTGATVLGGGLANLFGTTGTNVNNASAGAIPAAQPYTP